MKLAEFMRQNSSTFLQSECLESIFKIVSLGKYDRNCNTCLCFLVLADEILPPVSVACHKLPQQCFPICLRNQSGPSQVQVGRNYSFSLLPIPYSAYAEDFPPLTCLDAVKVKCSTYVTELVGFMGYWELWGFALMVLIFDKYIHAERHKFHIVSYLMRQLTSIFQVSANWNLDDTPDGESCSNCLILASYFSNCYHDCTNFKFRIQSL